MRRAKHLRRLHADAVNQESIHVVLIPLRHRLQRGYTRGHHLIGRRREVVLGSQLQPQHQAHLLQIREVIHRLRRHVHVQHALAHAGHLRAGVKVVRLEYLEQDALVNVHQQRRPVHPARASLVLQLAHGARHVLKAARERVSQLQGVHHAAHRLLPERSRGQLPVRLLPPLGLVARRRRRYPRGVAR